MKDSQVRIRIPIHHPKEHRQASLAEEGSGSIATSLQKISLCNSSRTQEVHCRLASSPIGVQQPCLPL